MIGLNEAIDVVRAHGFTVHRTGDEFPRETPARFRARHGISVAHFSRRLQEPGCPRFDHGKGQRRILWLVSNAELEAHMQPRGAGGRKPATERSAALIALQH